MADCVSLPNAAELEELNNLVNVQDNLTHRLGVIEALVRENKKLKAERDASPQWISVKDRLPSDDNEDWVLAVITEKNGYQWMPTRGEYRKGLDDWYFEETGWLRNHNGAFSVTHWMPLPEPPKEEEDAD